MKITATNLSTRLSDPDAAEIIRAIQQQMTDHFNPSRWVQGKYTDPVESVVLLPKGTPPPPEFAHLQFLDHGDQEDEGALGVHEEASFDNKVDGQVPTGRVAAPTSEPRKASPFSRRAPRADNPSVPVLDIFVGPTLDAGASVAEVTSHEVIEAAVDPHPMRAPRIVKAPNSNRQYIVEVCDAVQETAGYVIGRCRMANFLEPAYFFMEDAPYFDFFRVLKGAAPAMTLGGYLSYNDGAGWQQMYGSQS